MMGRGIQGLEDPWLPADGWGGRPGRPERHGKRGVEGAWMMEMGTACGVVRSAAPVERRC